MIQGMCRREARKEGEVWLELFKRNGFPLFGESGLDGNSAVVVDVALSVIGLAIFDHANEISVEHFLGDVEASVELAFHGLDVDGIFNVRVIVRDYCTIDRLKEWP